MSPIITVLKTALLTIASMTGVQQLICNSADIDITKHITHYLMAHQERQLLMTKYFQYNAPFGEDCVFCHALGWQI